MLGIFAGLGRSVQCWARLPPMAGKRAPVVLALVAIVAVGLLLFFLGQGGDRAGRRGTSDGRGAETEVTPGSRPSEADKAAYEARLEEILKKYGVRNGAGTVYLTKPKAPGVGLKVTVRRRTVSLSKL